MCVGRCLQTFKADLIDRLHLNCLKQEQTDYIRGEYKKLVVDIGTVSDI